ncbi:hypothetical protein B0H13DRAFT_2323831 [Mycena leptocephala]|nr:hypothetical protein B0H13DRAFT_2323831 [Mycena leptocephala]
MLTSSQRVFRLRPSPLLLLPRPSSYTVLALVASRPHLPRPLPFLSFASFCACMLTSSLLVLMKWRVSVPRARCAATAVHFPSCPGFPRSSLARQTPRVRSVRVLPCSRARALVATVARGMKCEARFRGVPGDRCGPEVPVLLLVRILVTSLPFLPPRVPPSRPRATRPLSLHSYSSFLPTVQTFSSYVEHVSTPLMSPEVLTRQRSRTESERGVHWLLGCVSSAFSSPLVSYFSLRARLRVSSPSASLPARERWGWRHAGGVLHCPAAAPSWFPGVTRGRRRVNGARRGGGAMGGTRAEFVGNLIETTAEDTDVSLSSAFPLEWSENHVGYGSYQVPL